MVPDANSAQDGKPFPAYPPSTALAVTTSTTPTPFTPFLLASGGRWHLHARRPAQHHPRPCTSGHMPSWTEGVERCVWEAACPRGASLSPDSLDKGFINGTGTTSPHPRDRCQAGACSHRDFGPCLPDSSAISGVSPPCYFWTPQLTVGHGLLGVGLSLCPKGLQGPSFTSMVFL